MDIVRVCIFVSFFLLSVKRKYYCFSVYLQKFCTERVFFYLKEFFSKIKFYLYFLKYRKVMHIQLSNKVLNTVMQKNQLLEFLFLLWFLFFDNIHIPSSPGTMYIYQYPIDKICRQINCCKHLLQNAKNEKYYNLKKKKRECLMCAIARFSYSNSEFFLKLLV